MSETVIQVTSLGKRIKGKTILEDISFEIKQGDCVALIGPNGAGKTVLMSCILGDKNTVVGKSSSKASGILSIFWTHFGRILRYLVEDKGYKNGINLCKSKRHVGNLSRWG